MAKYVLVEDVTNKILKEVDSDIEFRDGIIPNLPKKAFRWLPIVAVDPSYDPATEIKGGPTDVIAATEVIRTWKVRAKTADELDEMVAASKDMTILVNTLVNALVLNSTAFPADLIGRVNARNRFNGDKEI